MVDHYNRRYLLRVCLSGLAAAVVTSPAPLLAARARSLAILGDSTVAGFAGMRPVSSFLRGVDADVLALPGHTIGQQRSIWVSRRVHDHDAVLIQLGLNDLKPGRSAREIVAELQALIDAVRADSRPGCRIYVSKMSPAHARWVSSFGRAHGGRVQRTWEAVNAAIAGAGPTPVRRVDGRVGAHVPQLADARGNLRPEFDTGDGIHLNDAGRRIVAAAWQAALAR